MAYNKQNWKNLPDQTTPLSADRLNHLETQYEEAVSYTDDSVGTTLNQAKSYTDQEILNYTPDVEDEVKDVLSKLDLENPGSKIDPRLLASFTGSRCVIVMAGASTTARERYPLSFMNKVMTQFTAGVQKKLADVSASQLTSGLNLVNAGVGSTTSDTYLGSGRASSISNLNPDIMVHGVGTNDWYHGRTPMQYADDLDAAISSVTSNRPLTHIIVHQHEITTVQNPEYSWNEFRDAAKSVAEVSPEDRMFIDLAEPMRSLGVGVGLDNRYSLLDSDGVHLTSHGDLLLGILLAESLGIAGEMRTEWKNITVNNGYTWDQAGERPGYIVKGGKLYLRGRISRSGTVPASYQACTSANAIPDLPGVRGAGAKSVTGRTANNESLVRITSDGAIEVASGTESIVFLTSEFLIYF